MILWIANVTWGLRIFLFAAQIAGPSSVTLSAAFNPWPWAAPTTYPVGMLPTGFGAPYGEPLKPYIPI